MGSLMLKSGHGRNLTRNLGHILSKVTEKPQSSSFEGAPSERPRPLERHHHGIRQDDRDAA